MLESKAVVQVVVGIVLDSSHQVLVSLRAADTHQGGLWEFPGGKRERDESLLEALARELDEEMNVTPLTSELFYRQTYTYPERNIELFFYLVRQYAGRPYANEGQQWRWTSLDALDELDFPAANQAVLAKLKTYFTQPN